MGDPANRGRGIGRRRWLRGGPRLDAPSSLAWPAAVFTPVKWVLLVAAAKYLGKSSQRFQFTPVKWVLLVATLAAVRVGGIRRPWARTRRPRRPTIRQFRRDGPRGFLR